MQVEMAYAARTAVVTQLNASALDFCYEPAPSAGRVFRHGERAVPYAPVNGCHARDYSG